MCSPRARTPTSDGRPSPVRARAAPPRARRWAIKGRVSQKGPKKTYTNARGEGTLFSFTLCDADADIRLTCFNDVALRLHPIVNVGDILFVRNGQVRACGWRGARERAGQGWRAR